MQTMTAAASDHVTARAWLRHGAALAALVGLAAAVFQPSISAAVTVWWVSPTYSHCFLILPIVMWLIWEKRPILAAVSPGLAPKALLVMPLLALGWWVGELSAINEVQQYALIALLQAAIVALLGINVIRVIWFPVLYLLFLVPTGEYLIVPMQHFATYFVDVSLTVLGIPHYTEGTVFELTNGRFEIAEACAGLRFLIATVTLGVLFSYMTFRKIYKTALFLIACVAVPLFGNGLRCVGIIVLAHFTNNEFGAGADHIVYGWGFNVAILLVLGAVGYLFRDEFEEVGDVRPSSPVPSKDLAMVTALAALLLSAGPAIAWWHDNSFVRPDLTAIAEPFHAATWRQVPVSTSWHPDFSGLDAEARASILPPENDAVTPVDLFLGYYARPRPGHSMTAHINHFWHERAWTLSDTGAVTAEFSGRRVQFREWIIASPFERRLIWSSYWVNGHFTTSLFKVKLLQSAAALQGREGQAVFALSTIVDGTVETARRRLARSLPELDQLSARLDQANHQGTSSNPSTAGGMR